MLVDKNLISIVNFNTSVNMISQITSPDDGFLKSNFDYKLNVYA